MSDTLLIDRLNLQDTIARIDRAQEETRKFVAEQQKLAAERDKLAAEACKLERDRLYAPILAAAAVSAAVAGAVATLVDFSNDTGPAVFMHRGPCLVLARQ